MKVTVNSKSSVSPVDLVILAGFEGTSSSGKAFQTYDAALHGQLTELVQSGEWSGKDGESMVLHTLGHADVKRIALVGLGAEAKATEDTFRKAAAIAIQKANSVKALAVRFEIPALPTSLSEAAVGQAIAEGAILANYHFEGYAKVREEHTHVEHFVVSAEAANEEADLEQGVAQGVSIAAGVNLARDLVNTPGNRMTPTNMAERAVQIAEQYQMTYEVLDREQMIEYGMGALLAVAQGSSQPPKMMVLKYQGKETWDDVIGFVGKGITFDSGGISIKPAAGMEDMKMDMGGGAAVLGAMEAIGQLRPNVNVIGVVAATENMPSGDAYKPGDVIQAMTGKTIEVLNTDAEGRLALADAVAYAKHLGASRIVDLATLTGAVLVALGKVATGAMTNDETFLHSFMTASKRAGEKVWQLPLFDEYREQIKSDIADVKNTGGRFAGTITAGLFIEAFVEDTPWIHLDIAGTAWTESSTPMHPKGATGVMVRSLVEYALSCQ